MPAETFLPAKWPAQADLLVWCQNMTPGVAALLVLVGVVYLMWGYQLFRILVTVNAALVGAYVGALVGLNSDNALTGGLVGAFVLSAVTIPLMKYAVAVQGGVLGALLGAAAWQMAKLDIQFAWSGALVGLVFCGMLSFIIYRLSIIMYTSVQGSVMLIVGLLGLIYKYNAVVPHLNEGFARPMLLPLAVFIPALVGLIFQQVQSSAALAGAKKK